MRLIKLYEEFQLNYEKIKQDIEDIFVELLDKGYLVDVNINYVNNHCLIEIIKKDNSYIIFEDIEDSFMMFEDYINEKSFIKLKYYNFPSLPDYNFEDDNFSFKKNSLSWYGKKLRGLKRIKIGFYTDED